VSIEERVRTATEATAATVCEIRPLTFPDEAEAHSPVRRVPRPRSGWNNWLVPLAAAAAVIAVAATLSVVRGIDASGGKTAPAGSVLANGLPRYDVALSYTGNSPKGAQIQNAYLVDTSTGKKLGTFKPASDAMFNDIAGSANNTTFVLQAIAGPNYGPAGTAIPQNEPINGTIPRTSLWYVLRVTPGAAQPGRLAPISLAAQPSLPHDGMYTGLQGMAVSPDGKSLAILSTAGVQTYSLATGKLLHSWTGSTVLEQPADSGGLTWENDGHTLVFQYPDGHLRALDTAGTGTSLIADSRQVFSEPGGGACTSMLMARDGRSVICGSMVVSHGCARGEAYMASYSVATGKLEQVIYEGTCLGGGAQLLWAGSATQAIAEVVSENSGKESRATIGVMPPGKTAPLPAGLGEAWSGDIGSIAF
jgi:hypothetical protein